jgi:hypothetical protein
MSYTSAGILVNGGAKPIGYDYNSTPVHVVGTSNYEQKTFSCTPPTLSLAQGSNTSIELTWASDDVYMVEDLVLEWVATNSDPTNAPTFKNLFQTLASVKLIINGNEASYIMDQYQIQAKVSLFLSQYAENPYNKLVECRQENGTTLNGDSIAVSSTQNFAIPLMWLFPELKNFTVNASGIYKIKFDVSFQNNQGSTSTNGYFVVSNTTGNAYSTNLVYSQIQLRVNLTRHSDPRMYKVMTPTCLISDKFDTVSRYGVLN